MTIPSLSQTLLLLCPLFLLLHLLSTHRQAQFRTIFQLKELDPKRRASLKPQFFFAGAYALLGIALWMEGEKNDRIIRWSHQEDRGSSKQIVFVLDTTPRDRINIVLNTLSSLQEDLQGFSFSLLSTHSSIPLLVPPTYDLSYLLLYLDTVISLPNLSEKTQNTPSTVVNKFLKQQPYAYQTLTIVFSDDRPLSQMKNTIFFPLSDATSLDNNFLHLKATLSQFADLGKASYRQIPLSLSSATEQTPPPTLLLLAGALFLLLPTLYPASTFPVFTSLSISSIFLATFIFCSAGTVHMIEATTTNETSTFDFSQALLTADGLFRQGAYIEAEQQLVAALSQNPPQEIKTYLQYNLGLIEAHLDRYQVALEQLASIQSAATSPKDVPTPEQNLLRRHIQLLQDTIIQTALYRNWITPSHQILEMVRPLIKEEKKTQKLYEITKLRFSLLELYKERFKIPPFLFLALQRAIQASDIEPSDTYLQSLKQELLTYAKWSKHPLQQEDLSSYKALIEAFDEILASTLLANETQDPVKLLLKERALAFFWKERLPNIDFLYQARTQRVSLLLGETKEKILSNDPESDIYYWEIYHTPYQAGRVGIALLSEIMRAPNSPYPQAAIQSKKEALLRYFPTLQATAFNSNQGSLELLMVWVNQHAPYTGEIKIIVESLLNETANSLAGLQSTILPETIGIVLESGQTLHSTQEAATLLLHASNFLLQAVKSQQYDLGTIGLFSTLQALKAQYKTLELAPQATADFGSLSDQGLDILRGMIKTADWSQTGLVEDQLFQVSRIVEQLFTLLQPPFPSPSSAQESTERQKMMGYEEETVRGAKGGKQDPIAFYQLLERRDQTLLQEAKGQ